ncbi:hypothetical protein [Deinococcus multiflagellatus]|uniref:OmpR/PhoB-type domain-containing protein n=1 Tax=Deinococcus multiflagellatus TaxID=1656887 RepID=A0ABW1ZQS5_9DEIO|nr:hypothetical protein [Deinococcus multiflagellatus]MBZ9715011.1 hypothetical protein [Deinococcus multiflagellatus]
MQDRLQLLGPPTCAGQPLPPHKPVALLLHLAYTGDWVRREALAALFWPEDAERRARHNLRGCCCTGRARSPGQGRWRWNPAACG